MCPASFSRIKKFEYFVTPRDFTAVQTDEEFSFDWIITTEQLRLIISCLCIYVYSFARHFYLKRLTNENITKLQS